MRPEIGLYFTDEPPSLHPTTLVLRNDDIDIPPGEPAYVIEDRVEIPVPVKAIGIYPHAHYLGKSVEVWAERPGDKERTWLIHIPRWDFNWQDDYRYQTPVELPAGTRIFMRYVYDNSAANIRNPSNPPSRVKFGNQSTDEMATLSLQVLPRNEKERWLLAETSARTRLGRRPQSWFLNNLLGTALNELGQHDEAAGYFRTAMNAAPGNPNPIFNLGNTFLNQNDFEAAANVYAKVLRVAPTHPRVRNNFAIALQSMGRPEAAVKLLREQLELNPEDARVHYNLGVSLLELEQLDDAVGSLRRAAALAPNFIPAQEDLGEALRQMGSRDESRELLEGVLKADPKAQLARYSLALLAVDQRRWREAETYLRRLFGQALDYLGPLNGEAWRRATRADKKDPRGALFLAELGVAIYPDQSPELLDTLAAALAANGRFDDAVHAVEQAIAVARLTGKSEYLEAFGRRRDLYTAGEKFIESR